jgi:Domain of unknown function (DUF5658)
VAERIPGPNLRRLLVGLDVEREPFRLAAKRHHLVHRRHCGLLCRHRASGWIHSENQIVGEGFAPCRSNEAAMSLRDLLSFNLFLQLTDGLVSYQSFALGAVEANPVVAAAMVKWGIVWGLAYNKLLACLLLFLIFALRHNSRSLTQKALSVTASVYVCTIIVCLGQLFR